MRFVVVTGMSGSGKRTAMKMLEDVGFYCVDNLPIPLVEKFAQLVFGQSGQKQPCGPGDRYPKRRGSVHAGRDPGFLEDGGDPF